MNDSKYQKAIYKAFQLTNKNISISAVAGSGKTTTLLQLLSFIPDGTSSLFLAFNNSIVDELKERNSREDVSIMTIHSCGWRAIMKRYGSRVKMNPNKCIAKTEKVIKELNIDGRRKGYFFYIIPKILDLMRCNLCENTVEAINKLMLHYDMNVEDEDIKIAQLAYKYLIKDKSQFDFMDMIFVPVTDDSVRLNRYEYVFCDESQDFSLCQHEFIKKCIDRGGRLVTVGDPNQAIYGFAGADANSYNKLSELNGASVKMPLSVCYRCGKNIVYEAQKIVPEIQFNDTAIDGMVTYDGSLQELQRGDWVLCRNLRPLVATYLWLLKNKIKSKIRGKDIGEGILALMNKIGAKDLNQLEVELKLEVEKLHDKLKAKGVKRPNYHPKMELLQQRMDVIECLSGEVNSVKELKSMIADIFTDDVKGILLSTIHKAKGLQNKRIFFLCPELIPSRYATMDWQFEQEMNLKYVAITRAQEELIYVSGKQFSNDITNYIKL